MSEIITDPIILSHDDLWVPGTKITALTEAGRSVMRLEEQGTPPTVDLLEIPEGRISGPYMHFIGSTACRDALLDNEIISGAVVRGYHLVVASPGNRPLLLSGRVKDLKLQRGRGR